MPITTPARRATDLADLRVAYRRAPNVREAYRINAVILLDQGMTSTDVADALLIDPDAARNDESDVVMFIDATHPQRNPVIGCGWLLRGEAFPRLEVFVQTLFPES